MFDDEKKERRRIYQKEYREKNKDRLKECKKEYRTRNKDKIRECRMKNREKFREYKKNYIKKNIDRIRERRRRYYAKMKEKYKDYMEKNRNKTRRYRIKNKDKIKSRGQKKRNEILKSWEDCIPKETSCQICGKKIYFNQSNLKDAIHFDHKNEIIELKRSPTQWLLEHEKTPNNQKIWESFKFGLLCHRCNIMLPTSNRKQFIINAIKYMGLDEIILDLTDIQQEMKLVKKKPSQEENLL